jgi:flagellar protein FliO/FliZ
MQWLNNLPFGDNRPLQIAALFGIAILVILVLIVGYRVLFGNRLRFSAGGKARQPRLGLVDAFSLDGQRQLVIVRRDNVEHLLMIGGPNDVVVEAQIVRAQPQAPARDKDVAVAPLAAPPAPKPAAAAPVQSPPAPVAAPVRPVTQPGQVVMPSPARPPNRAEPVPPPPPKPAQTPAPQPPVVASPAYAPKVQPAAAEQADARAPAKPLVLPLRQQSAQPPKPSPLPPPIVVAPTAAPAKSLVVPIAASPPALKAPSPPAPAPASGAKADPFAGLDSLEAEMARLLGRDP